MTDVLIDPGEYLESYYVLWRARGRRVRRGPFRGRPYRIRNANPAATYWIDVGDFIRDSAVSFRVDRSSSIVVRLSKPDAAEVVSGNTVRLRSVPLRIDPGEFRGEYRPTFRVRGGRIAAVRGPIETRLVPDMTYRMLIGRQTAAATDAYVEFKLDRKGRPRDKWIDPPQAAEAKGRRIRLRTRKRQIRTSFPANVGGYNVTGNAVRALVRGVPVSACSRGSQAPAGPVAVSVGRRR